MSRGDVGKEQLAIDTHLNAQGRKHLVEDALVLVDDSVCFPAVAISMVENLFGDQPIRCSLEVIFFVVTIRLASQVLPVSTHGESFFSVREERLRRRISKGRLVR
ncbi:hypothetical protein D9M68_726340 [compost metagenome]